MLSFLLQMQDLFIQSLTGLAYSLSHLLVGKSYQAHGQFIAVIVYMEATLCLREMLIFKFHNLPDECDSHVGLFVGRNIEYKRAFDNIFMTSLVHQDQLIKSNRSDYTHLKNTFSLFLETTSTQIVKILSSTSLLRVPFTQEAVWLNGQGAGIKIHRSHVPLYPLSWSCFLVDPSSSSSTSCQFGFLAILYLFAFFVSSLGFIGLEKPLRGSGQ